MFNIDYGLQSYFFISCIYFLPNHQHPQPPVYLSFVLESKLKWVTEVKTRETEVDLEIEETEEMTGEKGEGLDPEPAAGEQ